MRVQTDIDIDVANRDDIISKLKCRTGRIDREGDNYDKHNTGVYFQDIPYDPFTNISTIDHKVAEELGYFKVDLLNVHFYKDIRNEEHLNELVNREPLWQLLEHEQVVSKLFQIHKHFDLVNYHKPKSVEEIAMLIAILRPGKAYLQRKSWDDIRKEVWVKPSNNEYWFKKAHAFSYAMVIVAQLNLLAEQAE
jgi:hypothetical protein